MTITKTEILCTYIKILNMHYRFEFHNTTDPNFDKICMHNAINSCVIKRHPEILNEE